MNVEVWQCWASTVGIAQCGLIWAGLKQMRAVSEARDRQAGKRHAESMQALPNQREAQERESQRRTPRTCGRLRPSLTEPPVARRHRIGWPLFRAVLAFTVVHESLPRIGGPFWPCVAVFAKALFRPTEKQESSYFNRAYPTIVAFFAQNTLCGGKLVADSAETRKVNMYAGFSNRQSLHIGDLFEVDKRIRHACTATPPMEKCPSRQ